MTIKNVSERKKKKIFHSTDFHYISILFSHPFWMPRNPLQLPLTYFIKGERYILRHQTYTMKSAISRPEIIYNAADKEPFTVGYLSAGSGPYFSNDRATVCIKFLSFSEFPR